MMCSTRWGKGVNIMGCGAAGSVCGHSKNGVINCKLKFLMADMILSTFCASFH